ncbi:MAG: hypothetical protein HC813_04120 [Planctomycetes bacterium]|nr:hypothetical protein [Planctomycetota bacterium]
MIRERLWNGDVLRVLFGEDLGFDVWVEKYGNPPQVFFEGKALPIDRLDEVLDRLDRYVSDEAVRLSWNGHIPTKR